MRRNFAYYSSSILLIALLFSSTHCDKYQNSPKHPEYPGSGQLKGTGLFLQDGQLFWNITVGILQDSEFEEASLAQLRPVLLESTREMERILPGIKLKYIIDQPLNAVFMIQRTLGQPKQKGERPAFLAALSEQSSLLLLSNSANAKRINRQKLKNSGLDPKQTQKELQYLEALQNKRKAPEQISSQDSTKNSAGTLLSEKLTLRDSVWRTHLSQQVRYDLILSNALIYPDDLKKHRELLRNSRGTLRLGLAAMPGRSGMEAYGAYLSYVRLKLEKDTLEVRHLEAEELKKSLLLALTALLFPLELKFIDTFPKFELFKSFQKDSFWKEHWQKRLAYLKAIAALHRGKTEACRQLRKNKIDYNTLRDAKTYSPSKVQAEILSREYIKFLSLCPKK